MQELIRRKRDRGRLSPAEIESMVRAYVAGEVPDYQMAAWLMAAWIRGLNMEETTALALAMMNSGQVFDLSDLPGPKIDKHSTGGVGDKVSLILAPLVAAGGVRVPMVSGRSLGHTGGTLDKLESIPGFRTNLEFDEFRRLLGTVGVAMMGQTEKMCPADRKMYALRDVTATVDSIPLIAASIMSKKLAEGVDGLVLDVKTGTGAFMSRVPQARRLARTMIDIGGKLNKKVVALVTAMWQPLGSSVGNSLEVVESIEALKGRWREDLKEVTLALGAEMLLLAGRASSAGQARRLMLRALTNGKALDTFKAMVEAQGGDGRVVDDYARLPRAEHSADVRAESAGYVRSIDALRVGMLGVKLGIGRARLESKVDHGAGFKFEHKVGDKVAKGDLLASVFASDKAAAGDAASQLARVVTIAPVAPKPIEPVICRLDRC